MCLRNRTAVFHPEEPWSQRRSVTSAHGQSYFLLFLQLAFILFAVSAAKLTSLCCCRLAAQQEELEVLRSSLEQVLQAKEEDLQLYSTMISQVKEVFLQALRQHKQSSKQET